MQSIFFVSVLRRLAVDEQMSLALGWYFQIVRDKEPQAVWLIQLIAQNKCFILPRGGFSV